MLYGQNFKTDNILIERPNSESVFTGAYSPYGVPNVPSEVKKGLLRASGSILRANLDGTGLEIFAWGFRNPAYMRFDEGGNLFVANNGYELRGSRPIANAFDEFFYVTPGAWYGRPDYSGGEPVNLPKFKPEGGVQPEFLLKYHPDTPPKPYAIFPAQSGIRGFDFNYDRAFGPYRAVYIAEFGSTGPRRGAANNPYMGVGQRISMIDMISGSVSTFAINKSGFLASMTLEGN